MIGVVRWWTTGLREGEAAAGGFLRLESAMCGRWLRLRLWVKGREQERDEDKNERD